MLQRNAMCRVDEIVEKRACTEVEDKSTLSLAGHEVESLKLAVRFSDDYSTNTMTN